MLRFSLLLVLFSISVSAQQTTTSQSSGRVLIPVVVTTQGNAVIRNLNSDEFSIDAGWKAHPPAAALEVNPALLQPAADGTQKRPVYLVFDKLTLGRYAAPSDLDRVYQDLIHFLADTLRNQQPVTLLTIDSSGPHAVHQVTTAPEILAAAIKQVDATTHALKGSSPGLTISPQFSEQHAQQIASEASKLQELSQVDKMTAAGNAAFIQLAALQQTADAMRRIPGRKALVWLTGGLFFEFDDALGIMRYLKNWGYQSQDQQLSTEYERLVEKLNDAHVSLYPVAVTGGGLGLETIARSTGGATIPRVNIATAVDMTAEDCGTYYLLSYDPPTIAKRLEWRKLKIRVNRDGARVRAPAGFFMLPPKDKNQ
jgi:VWFA-related protein